MSIPISKCLIYAAANGDEEAYRSLLNAMKINISCGHFTIFSCKHDPKCPMADSEHIDAIEKRLNSDLGLLSQHVQNGGTAGVKESADGPS